MSDDRLGPQGPQEHPILSGLAAMLGVTLVVGGLLAAGAVAAAKVAGVDDGGSAGGGSSAYETLYLPKHTELEQSTGPYITLSPGDDASTDSGSGDPGDATSRPDDPTQEPETAITLVAGQSSVGQMEPIDLNGTYPGGSGSILEVQQFKDGAWIDFPVTVPVNDDRFTTFIQASMIGMNRFRVVDTDTGDASNPVKVRIG